MLPLLAVIVAFSSPPNPNQYADWGREILAKMRTELYLPASKLYAEKGTKNGPSGPSFNWAAGVTLSALNAAAAYDPKFKPWLREYADAVQSYWMTASPVAGFDVLPNAQSSDRYYDDNEWMVLALTDTAAILKDPKYLQRAKDAMAFVLSGKDQVLGGGIYWRENEKTTKNTCSNAPAAVAALGLANAGTVEPNFSEGKALYDWTHITLRDSETGLYWDNIGVSGKVGKTFWTYNTAMMIKASVMLYARTQDNKYAEQARQAEEASVQHWMRADGAIKDQGQFAHMLLEAWLMRFSQCPSHNEQFGATNFVWSSLNYLHDHVRDRNGHYGARWDSPSSRPLESWELIQQASAARAYFTAALYLRSREN